MHPFFALRTSPCRKLRMCFRPTPVYILRLLSADEANCTTRSLETLSNLARRCAVLARRLTSAQTSAPMCPAGIRAAVPQQLRLPPLSLSALRHMALTLLPRNSGPGSFSTATPNGKPTACLRRRAPTLRGTRRTCRARRATASQKSPPRRRAGSWVAGPTTDALAATSPAGAASTSRAGAPAPTPCARGAPLRPRDACAGAPPAGAPF